MEAYFLSDIHLKSVNERNGRTLLRFLASLVESKPGPETHLFLLGDIFDFWVSGHEVLVRKYNSLLEPIRDLLDLGVQIYFFEGNHDLHIQPYWEKQLGVKVFTGPEYFKLGPWTVRCEHGDEINLDDKAYLRLRKVLRHPIVEQLGHQLPGPFWETVGNFLSRKSRNYSSAFREDKEKELVHMIRHHAERSFDEKSFDYIINGHMHVRDEYHFSKGQKKAVSVNLGSWFDDAKVLKLTDTGHKWIALS